jgi:hypothetical protein
VKVMVPENRRRGAAPLRLPALLVAGIAAGCASSPPEPPASPGPHGGGIRLVEPHWDQVCSLAGETPFLDRVTQVLDPDGLEERVRKAFRSMRPQEEIEEESRHGWRGQGPFVDMAVSYARSGEVRTAHLVGTNVDNATTRALEDLLVSHLRSPGPLLEQVDLRVRAIPGPGSPLRILPPLRCRPHLAHEEDLPPQFLGGARVTGGDLYFGGDDGSRVSVWLHISAEGVLEGIEFRAGNEGLLGRVEESLAETRFDPALRNWEPVPGVLPLTFHFPD